MLNLASLYLEGRDPPHGAQEAVDLVKQAIALGIPAAYDRLGTYYMNGTGVHSDATKAYAYWQKAADLGSPNAMTYLGEKLAATWNNPDEGFWANMPVAKKMLECAFSQGHGNAAFMLHFLYAYPRAADGTRKGPRSAETKARALAILHSGTKLGCVACARTLAVQFRNPPDLADMLAPQIDEARAERYSVFEAAISFNPSRRFLNLDKVLPLPPARLPPWDGKPDSLLQGAMGVTSRPAAQRPSFGSLRTVRQFLGAAFDFRPAEDKTSVAKAPSAGYWRQSWHRPRQERT